MFPFIEQQNVFDKIDFSVRNDEDVNPSVLNGLEIENLYCPSDPDKGLYSNSRDANYTPGSGNGGQSIYHSRLDSL